MRTSLVLDALEMAIWSRGRAGPSELADPVADCIAKPELPNGRPALQRLGWRTALAAAVRLW